MGIPGSKEMRRIVSFLLAVVLCFSTVTIVPAAENIEESLVSDEDQTEELLAGKQKISDFTGIDDPEFLEYLKQEVYTKAVRSIHSDQYFVNEVKAIYISKEYLEESAYNMKTNTIFGYKLADLENHFQGQPYMFTVGEDGSTVVKKIETSVDATYKKILKNVAVGTGVIIVFVTVSSVSGLIGGAPAVHLIFTVGAKSAKAAALSGMLIGGVSAATLKGYQTGDMSEAISSGVVSGSESFKWGAISGAVTGAGKEAVNLKKLCENGLTINEAAKIQKQSGYPPEVIKQFKSMKEYEVYKEAELYPMKVNGNEALIRNIDLNYKSDLAGHEVTNLERMKLGYAPIDSGTGKPYELHHINQKNDGPLAILTRTEHEGNSSILNSIGKKTEIDREKFSKEIRKAFWKDYARLFS